MKKKLILGTVLALTSIALLSGCTSTSSTGAKKQIQFWHALSGTNGEAVKSLIADYNASQSNYEVVGTYQGNYYDTQSKILNSISSNTQPDVATIEISNIGTFASKGVLADITNLKSDSDMKVDDFIPGLMGNSYVDNKLYAIPFNRSTPLLYINEDMLKAAGLDEHGPKSWDELRSFSQKLSVKDQKWGFSTPVDIWFYEALVFQSGGKILAADGKSSTLGNDAGTAPVTFWKDMIAKGEMKMPPGKQYDAWDAAEKDFIDQKVAMIFDSTGSLNALMKQATFELGTAFLPANKSFGVPTGGANLVELKKPSDENKKGAEDFMKFATNQKNTISFSQKTGYMPTRTSAIAAPEEQAFIEKTPQFKVAIDQLQYAQPRPMASGYSELQVYIMDQIQKAIIDETLNPADVMKETDACSASKLAA